MNPFQVLGLQIAMSFLLFAAIARWYVAPRLAAQPWPEALLPLLLLHAYYQGLRLQPDVGAAYYIPAFVVPALLVTHAQMFAMLARRGRSPAVAGPSAAGRR